MSARGHFSVDQGSAVMNGEFMAFVADDYTQNVVRGWAERQDLPAATVQLGGPDMFAQMLETASPPKMAMVDIDGQADPVNTIARLISLCGSETKMVAVGAANDVTLYRQMIAAGAVDYLVKPLTLEPLNQAMTSALRGGTGGKAETKEAKLIVVLGIRGGVGASTVAINIAWLMAHELKSNCARLDLDLQFGTSSLALDLEPGRGLRDIVHSPHRVDGLMIASSMVPESDLFSVLGAEEAIDEHVPVDSSAITALLKETRGNFDTIIVEMPRHMHASQKRVLAKANEIVLVTELSLAGIRDTLRVKSALTALGGTGRITLVAARTGHVALPVFERSAQTKVDLIIPEDSKLLAEAANSGKAIGAVAKQAAVTKALRTLAERLAGTAPPAKTKGSILSLWAKRFAQNGIKKKG